MKTGGIPVSPASELEGNLRNVEFSDRVDRRKDFSTLDAIDEPPFLTEAGTLGQFVADLAAIRLGVDRLDSTGAERDGLRVIEPSLNFDSVC